MKPFPNHISTQILAIISYVLVFFSLFCFTSRSVQALSLSNLEQQINISNGEFSTSSTSDSPTDNSLGLIHFDSSDYTGDTVYFEAVIKCDSCSGGNNRVTADLYNDAGSSQGSVYTSNDTYTRVRSSSLSLSADDYTVRFKRDATSGTAYIKAARLIIDQSNASLTDTQAQIELGNYENTTSTGAVSLSAPKYYLYNSSKYTGTINAYFEATIKTADNSTSNLYEFNNYDSEGEEWATTPENMADGSAANYAATASDSDVELLTANQCDGSELGAITRVDIQAYAYQSNDTTGSVILRPVFGGSSDGDDHEFNPETSDGWSSLIDITDDDNAPSSWSWSDVQNLDIDVVWNDNESGNTGYVAIVRIQVTYEDSNITANAQLYNVSDSTAVTNGSVSTSSNSYQRIRSASALTTNFDSLDQYEARIYTSNGSNTAYLSNAKLIIDQTEADGLDRTETTQHYITTTRTQTNTIYTQESFLNQFNPTNFSGTNNLEVYFEATMKTSGVTGYAKLYDVTNTEQIDDSTTSELTTTSVSLERTRSSNLAGNTDWPTGLANLDTIIKASEGETTTLTNSWLIIQAGAIDPQLTFTISGVAANETNNGVTSSVTTTITTIPFGNITVNQPKYATHELAVNINEAGTSYTVDTKLVNPLQGQYPANNIDPFVGDSATWASPQTWSSPTGTSANNNTGWIGANTSDTDVAGWSNGSGLFGPLGSSSIEVMRSNTGADETIYVSYAIEASPHQPADSYAGTLIYNILPVY